MKSPALALLAATGLLAGCGKPAAPGRPDSLAARVTVTTTVVAAEDVPSGIEIAGTVRATERARLAARLMGAIEDMPVALGQRVLAGDVLVRIAAGEISAQVAQARTRLETARRDLNRERTLQAEGASTAETVRNLEDRVTTAEAELRESEILLGYAVVRAPFNGVVARQFAYPGDFATPGSPLLELHGEAGFEIEAAVPETHAASLRIGSEIRVTIPASSTTFAGRVAEVSSGADASARAVPVIIAVPPGTAVQAGQFARLQVPGPRRHALFVPASAVSTIGQMERVFAVTDDQRAALRLVRTGARQGEQVEILSGLDAGDRIVLAPPADIQDGQPLEIRP